MQHGNLPCASGVGRWKFFPSQFLVSSSDRVVLHALILLMHAFVAEESCRGCWDLPCRMQTLQSSRAKGP